MSPSSAAAPSTAEQARGYQALRSHLAVLKLAAAAEALPAVLDAARTEKLTVTAALERLLAIEVEATEARRLAGRLRFACLPSPATLAEFDFDAQPGVDPHLIADLASCRFLETATNVLMIGPTVIDGSAVRRLRSCRSGRCCDRCDEGWRVAVPGPSSGELASQVEVLAVGLSEGVAQGLDVMSVSFLKLVDLGGQGEHERALGVRRSGRSRLRAGSGSQVLDPAA
jgi:hypothetical protein